VSSHSTWTSVLNNPDARSASARSKHPFSEGGFGPYGYVPS
jgi:hypothetical protein